MKWKNIYRGFLMGVSDVVPGVSGGTIAVVLGIYDQLIAAINGIFTREWKKHITFLIPLVIGIGAAIFSLSHVMVWLLENHTGPTYFLFVGLIIGILPYLFRESDAKTAFKWYHFVILIIGVVVMSQLTPNGAGDTVIADGTLGTYIFLFFSGFLASAAMILPGISGSFVLVIIGSYETIMSAVKNFDILIILVVGVGIIIGIITMSRIIHYFLSKHRTATFALIIGLVIGSIYLIYITRIMESGWTDSLGVTIASAVTFIVGLLIAFVLGKIEH